MKRWFWFLLSILVVLVDQLSKYFVSLTIIPYSPVSLLPMLNINLAYNTGAAFGFLHHSGEWHKWFFAIFSSSMSIVLLFCLWRSSKQSMLQKAALSLILGGAVGNLSDRAVHGYVLDFIDFYYKNYHFATFNFADSAIFVGAILLFLSFLHPQSQDSRNEIEGK